MSDHRYQIEISSYMVIHTHLCGSTSLIPEDVSSKLPSIVDLDMASNFLITVASGLVSRFADLSPTQTSVITRETLSTDSPQLVFEITEIDPWGAFATSQLFNRLDRYLRPKSLQKMRREERANLVIILYLAFIGVRSTPPPTGKTAQESLDSLQQALLAYMNYITPNILLPDSQLNCDIHVQNFRQKLVILVRCQNLNPSTGNTKSGMRTSVWIDQGKRRQYLHDVADERLPMKLTMEIRNRHLVDRTTYTEVLQTIPEYFWKERYYERTLGVASI